MGPSSVIMLVVSSINSQKPDEVNYIGAFTKVDPPRGLKSENSVCRGTHSVSGGNSSLHVASGRADRGTSLARNTHPHRITIGP